MNRYEQLKQQRQAILAIATKHGAYNVRIFGSVVRGEDNADSDIDFLVDYDITQISAWFTMGLIEDLEKLLNQKIDLVTTNALHYALREKITDEAMPL